MNKLIIEGTEYELNEQRRSYRKSNPVITFGDKIYIGEPIIDKPKKDYEIVSIKWSNLTFKKDSQIKDVFVIKDGEAPFRNVDDLLGMTGMEITSVKRLADGIIFKTGDTTEGNNIIEGFELKGDNLVVKMKTPLATAHWDEKLENLGQMADKYFNVSDGVAKEGQSGYAVHPQSSYGWSIIPNWQLSLNVSSEVHQFNFRNSAQNFIALNKPHLSLQEVLDFLSGRVNEERLTYLENVLSELSKSKL